MVSCDPLPLSSWLMVLLMVNKSGLACLVRIIVIVACFTTQVILVMIKGPPFFFFRLFPVFIRMHFSMHFQLEIDPKSTSSLLHDRSIL